MQPQRLKSAIVFDTQHVDVGQADKKLTHADRVSDQQGSSCLGGLNTARLAGPLLRTYDPTTPRSLVKLGGVSSQNGS